MTFLSDCKRKGRTFRRRLQKKKGESIMDQAGEANKAAKVETPGRKPAKWTVQHDTPQKTRAHQHKQQHTGEQSKAPQRLLRHLSKPKHTKMQEIGPTRAYTQPKITHRAPTHHFTPAIPTTHHGHTETPIPHGHRPIQHYQPQPHHHQHHQHHQTPIEGHLTPSQAMWQPQDVPGPESRLSNRTHQESRPVMKHARLPYYPLRPESRYLYRSYHAPRPAAEHANHHHQTARPQPTHANRFYQAEPGSRHLDRTRRSARPESRHSHRQHDGSLPYLKPTNKLYRAPKLDKRANRPDRRPETRLTHMPPSNLKRKSLDRTGQWIQQQQQKPKQQVNLRKKDCAVVDGKDSKAWRRWHERRIRYPREGARQLSYDN